MKLSVRNTLKGKESKVDIGAANAEITVELPGGDEVVSIITKESAQTPGLEADKEVYAVIKAIKVMIGVEH